MASDTNANISENNREPCFWCVKALKWIPVLFVMTIVVWSYYAYVVQLCYYTVESSGETAIYLILFHLLFLMFCWSYWQTIFTGIGTVPAKFKLSSTDLHRLLNAETEDQYLQILEEFSRNLPLRNRTISGGVRYCAKCAHVKPDRAHHCSMCGYCVLKMDHHCPWVNNCVNFFNYKYFILFLGYALLYCLYISITSFPYFVLFWKGDIKGMGRFNIFFLFFVAIIFVASLLSFFIYHLYLVFHNRTTIEAFRAPVFQSGPQKNGYDLGYYKNFQEVFGNQPRSWLLPVFTSLGDGVVFPVQIQHSNVYNSMGTTPNSENVETVSVNEATGLTAPRPENLNV